MQEVERGARLAVKLGRRVTVEEMEEAVERLLDEATAVRDS